MDRKKLAAFVIKRDGGCMAQQVELSRGENHHPSQHHICRGPLTLEHVTKVHSHLEGKVDDPAHCVALCLELNGGSLRLAPHWMKELFRERLRELYPELTYPNCRLEA